MRSPEHRYAQKNGHFEDDKIRNPGAFTILPPDNEVPPDPPHAPQPYRLTPSSRRHKNLAFAILPEPSSRAASRSPSPTSGRVSPFKGRGFNPAGSRHASPAPSPPLPSSPSHSKIPTLRRRGSADAFGEKVRPLTRHGSRSMTSLGPPPARRPAVSPPRRKPAHQRQRLSPIVGSSPEPSHPRSQHVSPTRTNSFLPNAKTKRSSPTSPTRIPVKRYNNVQAKVNSHHGATKTKAPLKTSNDKVTSPKRTLPPQLERKNSVVTNNKSAAKPPILRSASKKNLVHRSPAKTDSKVQSTKSDTKVPSSKTEPNVPPSKNEPNHQSEKNEPTPQSPKRDSPVKLADLLQPSATTVVASTTSTVTQPLKIDAKLKIDSIAPMVDGRVLSATSVSSAMNKMNDTVLDSQTMIKEHGLVKLSPAASTIIAMSNSTNRALDTKNATSALPSVEVVPKVSKETHHAMDNGGLVPSARVLEQHVQNNMSKLVSPAADTVLGNSVGKSVNDRIKEARTVVAQPIRITVKERPNNVEVQSGNIRFDTSNGISSEQRPGLPPPNQVANEHPPDSTQTVATQPAGRCSRFFTSCKETLTCSKPDENATKSKNSTESQQNNHTEKPTGCFSCRKSKKSDVTINIESDEGETKKTCWDRLNCCGKNRVGDSGCFPSGKRKDSWAGRRDSILSDEGNNEKCCSCCRSFFRKLFCLDCCKKKQKRLEVEDPGRRASMISKKKSLTPSVPHEDTKPKIDLSLVEHTSQMKGAIPILPICLAWFCLVMNCIAPGTGTVFSGMFCLCIGKPRFSQHDGPRPRIGSFIINLFIGFGQFFTVLFCLVGWGWSIWWGLIMIKIAKKHKKIKAMELTAEQIENSRPNAGQANHTRNSNERKS